MTGSTRAPCSRRAAPCPVGGCAWDSTIAASRTTNQFQAATNVHVLVGRFSEYLAQAADRLRRGVGQLPARQRERRRARQRLHPHRGQRRPGPQQRQLRDAARRQRAAHADVPVHGPQRERQRRGGRRLPRDRPRPLEPADRQRLRQRRAQRHPGVDDGRGLERLLRAGPAAVPGLGDRHPRGRGRHHRQPRLRAERHPLQADRLPGRAGRLRQLRPQRHGHRGAGRLHVRRPRPHEQRRRTAQRRRGVGRDAVGPPPRGRPRRRARADHGRHAADARTTRRCSTRATRSSSRRSRCAPHPDAPDDYFAEVWEVFRARGMGFDATTTGPADTAPVENFSAPRNALCRPGARAARPVPGRRQRRPRRGRRAHRGLRARLPPRA